MPKKIKIKSFTGGPDGADLEDLYFQNNGTPGEFLLFDDTTNPNTQITTTPTPLTSGTDFSFTFDDLSWTITNFLIAETSRSGSASESWSVPGSDKVEPGGGDPETGTFQANDGTVVEDDASASSAYA